MLNSNVAVDGSEITTLKEGQIVDVCKTIKEKSLKNVGNIAVCDHVLITFTLDCVVGYFLSP